QCPALLTCNPRQQPSPREERVETHCPSPSPALTTVSDSHDHQPLHLFRQAQQGEETNNQPPEDGGRGVSPGPQTAAPHQLSRTRYPHDSSPPPPPAHSHL
uniref:Uncharacterized protein n=1 Tax=Pelusios castaneus TaxID=367368 RepID=A0A8C8SN13_9SAUR